MEYHINRNGQELGVYTLDQLREGYRSGSFLPGDLVWRPGMAEWVALSLLPDLQPPEGAILPPGPEAYGEVRTGPAWENPTAGTWFERACETLKVGISAPSHFFRTLKLEGGIARPLMFYLLVGTVFGILGTMMEMGFELAGIGFGPFAVEGPPGEIIFTNVIAIVLMPLIVVIGAFIDGAITHGMLMLLGGANRPFETTFRVCTYSSALVAISALFPFCGALVSLVWAVVLQTMGLSIAHGIGTGKALAAILLPLVICCGSVMLIAFAIGFAM